MSNTEKKVSGIGHSLNYHTEIVEQLTYDVDHIKSVLPSIEQKIKKNMTALQ